MIKAMIKYIEQRFWQSGCLMLLALLVLTGCNAAAPIVAVTEARQAVVATPILIIVTSTPRPTATPLPRATLPYDISQVEGRWQAGIDYRLRGYPIFNDIRYSGSFEINVASDGTVTGSGTLYTTLDQPPCSAIAREGTNLAATLEGRLLPRAGGDVVGDLTIKPRDAAMRQTFDLTCAASDHSQRATVAILWPALDAIGQLHFPVPFKTGVVVSELRNLTGPSGGTLYGTLTTEIRLSR